MNRFVFFIIALLIGCAALAQERKISFGILAEPIIPTKLFRINTDVLTVSDTTSGNAIIFASSPRYGFAFGTILKFDFTPRFSFETGINYLVRNYKMEVKELDKTIAIKFNEDSYEIPLTGKYFIRLGKNLYLSNSAGLSLIFIPGSIKTTAVNGPEGNPDYYIFQQHSYIRRTLIPAFKGGFGLNFRTEEKGSFNFETYYRLFSVFYDTRLLYYNSATGTDLQNIKIKSIGDYFGFSIKYTFPPTDLIRRQKKKNKG